MNYRVVYLRGQKSCNITDIINGDLWFEELNQCQLILTTYDGQYCQDSTNLVTHTKYQTTTSYEVTVKLLQPIASVVMKNMTVIIFIIPSFFLVRKMKSTNHSPAETQISVDYHHWKWNHQQPSWILLPNLNNDPRYYFPIKIKKIIPLTTQQALTISRHRFGKERQYRIYCHQQMRLRFYVDTQYPITLYDSARHFVLGSDIQTGQYRDFSELIPWSQTPTYYLSCNELISRRLPPIVRLSIGIYQDETFLSSEPIILRIAPLLFNPVTSQPRMVYLSQMEGVQGNANFVKQVTSLLTKKQLAYQVLQNRNMSMYHRWLQDIMKFAYVTDGHQTIEIILKGPQFAHHTQKDGDVSYIYRYFKEYPLYDLFFENTHNLNAFGNIQVTPPVIPKYPFGRLLYGISSDETQQQSIDYNLIDLLESQQIQKPISIPTGWLHVGHIDEIMTFIPDSRRKCGFRVLLASPRRFYQLLEGLSGETLLFDSPETFYVFQLASSELQKHLTKTKGCLYSSQLRVKDILEWSQLTHDNQVYQRQIDQIKTILMSELELQDDDFHHIPIYYWPQSISPRAKSMIPNMINHLQLGSLLLVPKPFGPRLGSRSESNDLFEQIFKEAIPIGIKVVFIPNWDCYYLLDGDIHCGTNVKRIPSYQSWWEQPPQGVYDV